MPRLVTHNISREQFEKLKAERAAQNGGQTVEHRKQAKQTWPEPAAGVLSQLTYSYLWPLLCLGAEQDRTLSHDDLFDLPKPETSNALSAILQRSYYTSSEYVEPSAAGAKDSFWRLLRALWAIVKPLMIEAGWCNLLACSVQTIMPLLLRELVLGVAEPDPSDARRRGLRGTLLVLLGSVTQALSQQRQQHLAMRSGQRMRACLISEIFEKATTLSPRGRIGVSKGEVNNLVAVDTQKIFEVSLNAHLLWSSPLQVIVVAGLLLSLTGPSTLLGIATLVAVLPISKTIVKEFLRIRQLRMKTTDERVRMVSEILSGIRVTKLNGWEPLWIQRVFGVRRSEVKLTASELWIYGWSMMVMVMSPVLALMATICLQMLADPNARLSAADCFATLALIGSLRFPINQLGQLLGQAAQAWKAVERISEFLERESEEQPANDSDAGPSKGPTSEPLLQASNASFCVGASSNSQEASSFTIEGVDISARAGDVICVVGSVAAGKSTLLDGLQGFAAQVEGAPVDLKGSVAFAAQAPFILNATVKENITFGRPFESTRYDAALGAAQLSRDLDLLPAGDETEIGEKGVNLSGGQKARVALARCVYGFRGVGGGVDEVDKQATSVALLDDPLGALDASTALKIFDALFGSNAQTSDCASSGVLRSGASVLVTHATHFLPRPEVTQILVLKSKESHENQGESKSADMSRSGKGSVIFNGTWSELVAAANAEDKSNGSATPLSDLIASAVAPHGENDDETEDVETKKDESTKSLKPLGSSKHGSLIKVEQREEGVSSSQTWIRWVSAAGGVPFLALQITFLVLDRASYALTEMYLAKWTEAIDERVDVFGVSMPSQDESGSALKWSLVYFGLFVSGLFFCGARTQWGLHGGIRASRSLYLIAQERVLFAPMAFFDTTPLGRLLNRFSYDTEVVDVTMTIKASAALISFGWFATGVIVMTIISKGVMLFLLVPQAFTIYKLQLFYRRSAVDLQRIDAVSRSPLQSLLAEGLDGANTIRAFKMQSAFLLRLRAALDKNTGALLCWTGAQRWMGLRLDLLAAVGAVGAALILATLRDTLNITPGFAGVLMMWAIAQSITFMFLINTFTEAEAAATSVERIMALATETPQEAPHNLLKDSNSINVSGTTAGGKRLVAAPKHWPTRGELSFENVWLRYRPGLEPALRGLTFKVAAGTRCGVVGRTGAGKSTLVAALFRLAEEPLAQGRVMLDGVDLSTLCLRDVRARKPRGVLVIPQDPVLFSGSLRNCLDPFGTFDDVDLLTALDAVGLKQSLAGFCSSSSSSPSSSGAGSNGSGSTGSALLTLPVNDGGSNWSVGERQLLALARAMLEQPRVLVLDEATASVDGETDARIQRMLRTLPRLQHGQVTVLSVAHRLHTVIDFDQILVLDAGIAAECGPPASLLAVKPPGYLAQLVDATGPDSARHLRATANAAANATANAVEAKTHPEEKQRQ